MAPQSVELTTIDVRDPGQMERAITAFAREPNGGLIVTASQSVVTHRELIISLATRYRLPNVYAFRYYPASGSLASYALIQSTSSIVRLLMSIASSKARSPPTCQCRHPILDHWIR